MRVISLEPQPVTKVLLLREGNPNDGVPPSLPTLPQLVGKGGKKIRGNLLSSRRQGKVNLKKSEMFSFLLLTIQKGTRNRRASEKGLKRIS